MSGNLVPIRSSLLPMSGLGNKLMWSVMNMMSLTRKLGLMPPLAFESTNNLAPKYFITLIGKVISEVV